jgi:hypothetical protein
LEFCQSVETDDGESHGDSSANEEGSKKGIIACRELGQSNRKKRMVHFANPLVCYIEEATQETIPSIPVAEDKVADEAENDDKGSLKEGAGTRHQPKVPMSCFDLLCSHTAVKGLKKGWKCYRSCVEGESYCCFHLSKRNAAVPVVKISVTNT